MTPQYKRHGWAVRALRRLAAKQGHADLLEGAVAGVAYVATLYGFRCSRCACPYTIWYDPDKDRYTVLRGHGDFDWYVVRGPQPKVVDDTRSCHE